MAAFESIVVIGAGKMGGALVDGWIAQGVNPASVYLVDPALAKDDRGWRAKGVGCFASVDDLTIGEPALLLLAIKPQMMETVLPGLAPLDHNGLTVLSIAAGTTLATLQTAFPKAVCIRTMPNTPAAVGAGITAAFGPDVTVDVQAGVTALLEAVGQVVWLDTELAMDAVTAVSGSGPAYVFHMVEALAEAGITLGLSAETAMALARQTIVGAGELLAQSHETAAQLRTNVTSPGGTTAAGLSVLRDTGKLTDLMCDTTKAAFDRSVALAASKDVPKS
jgi:pyrroline-5-carboxylate reductase